MNELASCNWKVFICPECKNSCLVPEQSGDFGDFSCAKCKKNLVNDFPLEDLWNVIFGEGEGRAMDALKDRVDITAVELDRFFEEVLDDYGDYTYSFSYTPLGEDAPHEYEHISIYAYGVVELYSGDEPELVPRSERTALAVVKSVALDCADGERITMRFTCKNGEEITHRTVIATRKPR